MKQPIFEQNHQKQWQSVENWLNNLHKNPNKQTINEFPQLYRQLCQHLALAKDRCYTPYLLEKLNYLVLRGHQQLYSSRSRLSSKMMTFARVDFPNRVRTEASFVGLANLLFFGSFIILFISIQIEPNLVYSLLSPHQVSTMESMYNPTATHIGRDRASDSDFLMFGYYIKNNIGIAFQTFASGVFFCLGTLFFLLFNGLYMGSVAGHLTYIGYHVPFYSFVAGHSALELIAITLSGAAGLKLGWALIAPQRYSRLQALRNAAKGSIELMYGAIGMLVLAAFIEAFWSSKGSVDPFIKYTVGLLLWIAIIGYFVKVGRNRAN